MRYTLSIVLVFVLTACRGFVAPSVDAGASDAATADAAAADAPSVDAGSDAGSSDAGGSDAGSSDAGSSDAGSSAVVTTTSGDVGGTSDGDLVVFEGIPYAEPPLGALRFRAPLPHAPWSGVRDATAFGSECPQKDRTGVMGDEDCLFVNVWAHATGGPRPVMVFLYGGGFSNGDSSLGLYDGAALARAGGVTVVTLNYRVGALGYLATEALAADSGDGTAGNYGLRDQLLALAWVRDNIGAFGGDASQVTIFGESAGGLSVCALLGAPSADALFRAAIIESGGGCYGFEDPRDTGARPSMMDRGLAFATSVGCTAGDQVTCLRGKTMEELLTAQPPGHGDLRRSLAETLEYAPNVDGVLLPEDPLTRLRRGDRDVPIVVGSNADEARAFTSTMVPVLTWTAFENHVHDILGTTDGDTAIALYPHTDFGGPRQAYDAFGTDFAFTCPTFALAEATAGGAPTYLYHFRHVIGGTWGLLGATHVTELFFVFANWPGTYVPDGNDLVVSADLQRAWSSLAATGTTPELVPAWTRYAVGAPAFAIFEAPATIAPDIRNGRCVAMRAAGLVP